LPFWCFSWGKDLGWGSETFQFYCFDQFKVNLIRKYNGRSDLSKIGAASCLAMTYRFSSRKSKTYAQFQYHLKFIRLMRAK